MNLPDSPSVRRWTTAELAAGQRLSYWVEAISEGFLAMQASSPERQAFTGELVSAPLGEIGVNWVHASAQNVQRTAHCIARQPAAKFYLLGDLAQPWTLEQGDHSVRLAAGDFALVDAHQRYAFQFPAGISTVSLELPLSWLERWLPQPALHAARLFECSRPGWGAALAMLARQWTPALACNPPLPKAMLSDQLGSVLALACGEGAPAATGPMNWGSRIGEVIQARLSEPGLTADHVAATLDISARSVHRHMQAHRTTFAAALMQARMRRAQEMLSSPRLARLTVGEIGRRVGLVDPSHFVRQFKRYSGTTPGLVRHNP